MANHTSVVFVFTILFTSGCISVSSETAKVTEVVDGDTVDIRYSNGSEERIRLIGVDTPEVSGENSPKEFGMRDSAENRECLRDYGEEASNYVSRFQGSESRVVQDSVQRNRGGYGRLLAYIYTGNRSESLNQILLRKGLARVYYTEFGQRNSFIESERIAKTKDIGVWSCD